MKNKVLAFLMIVALGGILTYTYAPINDMAVISQNSSAMLAATSNTSAYVSATGNIDPYQEVQVLLLKIFWPVVAIVLIFVGIWQVIKKPEGE